MKKKLIIATISLIAILSSCDWLFPGKENFLNAYMDIFVAREIYTDTTALREEYQKIYEKYGYTEASFNKELLDYQKNTDEFLVMLDTIRARAASRLKSLDSSGLNH